MWLCILSGRWFENTHENAHWRKIEQMQPMQLCVFSVRQFENTFENAQWRKAKRMWPMWLFIPLCKRFEDTFWKRTVQWSQTNATNATIPLLKHAIWGHIWKCTVEKSQTNATNVTMHLLRQEIWGHIWKCKKKITFKSFFYKHDEIRFWGNSKSVQILQKISKFVGFWLSILLPSITIFYRCTKTDQMKVRVIRLKDYQSPNLTRTDNDSNISNQNLLLQLTSK